MLQQHLDRMYCEKGSSAAVVHSASKKSSAARGGQARTDGTADAQPARPSHLRRPRRWPSASVLDEQIGRRLLDDCGCPSKRRENEQSVMRGTEHQSSPTDRCVGPSRRVDAFTRKRSHLCKAAPKNPDPAALIGDKPYDPEPSFIALTDRQSTPVVASHHRRASSPPRDFAVYYERNFIERFFHNLWQFRAIATRYDSLARHFLGVHPAAASIIAR
jgi:hypothetical protein